MITFWGMGMTCIAIGHTSEADVEGCKGYSSTPIEDLRLWLQQQPCKC